MFLEIKRYPDIPYPQPALKWVDDVYKSPGNWHVFPSQTMIFRTSRLVGYGLVPLELENLMKGLSTDLGGICLEEQTRPSSKNTQLPTIRWNREWHNGQFQNP